MPFPPFTNMNKAKSDVELKTVLSHLNLVTVDETQTALANTGIHISETTAFRWRRLAKENPTLPLLDIPPPNKDDEHWGKNPICAAPEVKPTCFKRLMQYYARIIRK